MVTEKSITASDRWLSLSVKHHKQTEKMTICSKFWPSGILTFVALASNMQVFKNSVYCHSPNLAITGLIPHCPSYILVTSNLPSGMACTFPYRSHCFSYPFSKMWLHHLFFKSPCPCPYTMYLTALLFPQRPMAFSSNCWKIKCS